MIKKYINRQTPVIGKILERLFGPEALAKRLLRLIRPLTPVGRLKVRIGNTAGDGGYVMVDSFDRVTTALSLGIGGDVSWDSDIAARGIDVFQYDHTVSGPPISNRLFHFSKVGIGSRNSTDGTFKSLDQMVADLPATGDLIAKIDVEGAEWTALSSAKSKTLKRFVQLAIELHQPLYGTTLERLSKLRVLQRLNRTHAVVHVHANNYGEIDSFGRVQVPSVLEITYIRRRAIDLRPSNELLPNSLDRPNDVERADIAMTPILLQS